MSERSDASRAHARAPGSGGRSAPDGRTDPFLQVDLGAGLKFANPILTASGCFHYGQEFAPYIDLKSLGGVIVKSLSSKPWPGHPPPRGAETPSGMLNAIGLQNPGVAAFCDHELPWLVERRIPIIASIVGHSVEEYIRVADRLRNAPGVVALEVNISCPNLSDRSRMFSSDADATDLVIRGVRRTATQPIFTKLSPDVTDIVDIAKAAVRAGTHGFSIMNTTLGMAIDTESYQPKLSTLTGGLSGPAIRPIAIRCVYQVSRAFPDVPIIGQGGIFTGDDVAEFMLAGAWAVAVGTANFVDPAAALRILGELREYMARKRIRDVSQLRRMLKEG
jgi:dihydroorotate dehydrogenase (NAD+) catalytic subunit